jgi:hypothetical protein
MAPVEAGAAFLHIATRFFLMRPLKQARDEETLHRTLKIAEAKILLLAVVLHISLHTPKEQNCCIPPTPVWQCMPPFREM